MRIPALPKPFPILAVAAATLLAGCSSQGEITAEGIITSRSACPAVGVPAATGDITLFNPASSRDSSALDVVANITNLRSTCDATGDHVAIEATFDVFATRRDSRGARDVALPYFATVVQGGTNVVSKRLGTVALHFEDGQMRASTTGSASAQVLRSAATLPPEVVERITRRRKPGDADAALDPMADPAVRTAVQRSSFELLVGFQLTNDQLTYNATR